MIGKIVLIGVYLCSKALSIANFNNKPYKRETSIIKIIRQPFFDGEGDEQPRRCYELEVSAIWKNKIFRLRINRELQIESVERSNIFKLQILKSQKQMMKNVIVTTDEGIIFTF